MLDALVHFELAWFGEKVKERALGPFSFLGILAYSLTGGRISLLMVVNTFLRPLRWLLDVGLTIVLPGWWLWEQLNPSSGATQKLWALVLAGLFIFYCVQRGWAALVRREEPPYIRDLRLYEQMLRVYRLLSRRPVCPAQIKLELTETTRKGDWDAQTWMLVEAAFARNPVSWGLRLV